MMVRAFPSIDLTATGKRIAALRMERGLSVRDLQLYFGFDAPQAIYKWQKGAALPTVDNLLALSTLLEVPMESILVWNQIAPIHPDRTEDPEGSVFLCRFIA